MITNILPIFPSHMPTNIWKYYMKSINKNNFKIKIGYALRHLDTYDEVVIRGKFILQVRHRHFSYFRNIWTYKI
jgi:hypothetical protein